MEGLLLLYSHLALHWHWLSIGILLLTTEVATMSSNGYFLWFGLAAALVAAVTWIWPEMPLALQLTLFGVLSVAMALLWWKHQRSKAAPSGFPRLNQRGADLVGRTFPLYEAIVGGRGRIKVGDSLWSVAGPDLPAGTQVLATGQEGLLIMVVPA